MSSRPLFLFAPGAGAPSTHPWMQRWASLLGEIGSVHTLDYSYMLEGRKRPDPLPRLVAAHREALHRVRDESSGPLFLIGKSMGSRVGCHVSLVEQVNGLICLGYPLCGAGDRSKLRDQVLMELSTPVLFVQGTRDSLCPLDLLAEVRAKMTAPTSLEVVEGGDHSLIVTKQQLKADQQTQDDVEKRVLGKIAEHVANFSVYPGRMPKSTTAAPKAKLGPANSFHDLLEKSTRLINALLDGPLTRKQVCEVTGLSSPVAMNLLVALDAELGVKIQFNRQTGAYELISRGEMPRAKTGGVKAKSVSKSAKKKN